jgi:hypothetical protein
MLQVPSGSLMSSPAAHGEPPAPSPRRPAPLIGGVGGQAPALYDINKVSGSDLARIIPIAIAAIGLLLALVLRSLVAPRYLIASVGLSYLAALGLAVLVFITICTTGPDRPSPAKDQRPPREPTGAISRR